MATMDITDLKQLSEDLKKQAKTIDDLVHSQEQCDIKVNALEGAVKQQQGGASLHPKQVIRTDSLARAMQWCTPELIKKRVPHACLAKIERLLNFKGQKKDSNYNELPNSEKLERLLFALKNSDFDIIKQCLNALEGYKPECVRQVWKLYEQYGEAKIGASLCGYCIVRNIVDLKDFGRYLWRRDMISENLYRDILHARNNDKGLQVAFWKALDIEIKRYDLTLVMDALSDTFRSSSDKYGPFMADISEWMSQSKVSFSCTCNDHKTRLMAPADDEESDTETLTSDNDQVLWDHKAPRRRSRSTNAARKNMRQTGANTIEMPNRKSQSSRNSEIALKQKTSMPGYSASPSASVMPINVGRKKTTKIFNINNSKGPINVGSKFVGVGKQFIPDSSNDTDETATGSSDFDIRYAPRDPLPSAKNRDPEIIKLNSGYTKRPNDEIEMKVLNDESSILSKLTLRYEQTPVPQTKLKPLTQPLEADVSETDDRIPGLQNCNDAARNIFAACTYSNTLNEEDDRDSDSSDATGYETADDSPDKSQDIFNMSANSFIKAKYNTAGNPGDCKIPNLGDIKEDREKTGTDVENIFSGNFCTSTDSGHNQSVCQCGRGGNYEIDLVTQSTTGIKKDIITLTDIHYAEENAKRLVYYNSSAEENGHTTETATSCDENREVPLRFEKKSNQLYFDDNHYAI